MDDKSTAPTFKSSEFIRAAAGTSRDILTVLLQPDKTYTKAQVDAKAEEYLKREVKR